jgi:hypothetical protein
MRRKKKRKKESKEKVSQLCQKRGEIRKESMRPIQIRFLQSPSSIHTHDEPLGEISIKVIPRLNK